MAQVVGKIRIRCKANNNIIEKKVGAVSTRFGTLYRIEEKTPINVPWNNKKAFQTIEKLAKVLNQWHNYEVIEIIKS